jgi:hypothetical protein
LTYWLSGSLHHSTRSQRLQETARAVSETDRANETPDAVVDTKIASSDAAPLKLTDAERKASNEILSGLRDDLNAMEIANAEVIYQMNNEYVQHTFIQISLPTPEQLASAWENLVQRLAAKNLRNPVAQDLWSKAQYVEKSYVGRRDLPFRVMHSSRAKLIKDAQASLEIRNYEQKPEIRFTEHGSPFLSSNSGEGELYGPDLRKNNNWERYAHLLPLMPELSDSEPSGAEKTKH